AVAGAPASMSAIAVPAHRRTRSRVLVMAFSRGSTCPRLPCEHCSPVCHEGWNKRSIDLFRLHPPLKRELAKPARGQRLPYFHVFAQHARPRLAGKYVAVLVDGAELRPAAGRGHRIAALVEDEVLDPAVLGVADPDPLLEARIVDVVRFGIKHVDHVVVV